MSIGSGTFDSVLEQRKKAMALIGRIKEKGARYDPFELLALCNKISAWEWVVSSFKLPHCPPGLFRAGEYLQAVLVSTLHGDQVTPVDGKVVEVVHNVSDLYDTMFPLNGVDGVARGMGPLTQEQQLAIFSMQAMYYVRGRRDATFQHWFYSFLLRPQADLFMRCWGIEVDRVIDGIDRLLQSLRFGMYRIYKIDQKTFSSDFYRMDHLPAKEAMMDCFDVEMLTGWPKDFIKELSFPIAGDTSFYSGALPGSPDNTFILRDRPFVQIQGRYYAFNYYLIADFFYRAVQKCVERMLRERHENSNAWNENQCSATESEARGTFRSLLPDAQIFSNNHYKTGLGCNAQGENDLLVVWRDVLIIVEVKGRRRWAEPPAEHASAMVMQNFSDIKDAIEQCNKVENYILQSPTPVFFDESWKSPRSICLDGIRHIFKIVLLLDGENEITSCRDALKGITQVPEGVLCISFDDIHVYEKYFANQSLLFMCYLYERLRATSISKLKTFDELDHLDGFIRNPNYVDEAIRYKEKGFTSINPGTYEGLDGFFAALNNPDVGIVMPRIALPPLFNEIIEVMQRSNKIEILEEALWLLRLQPEVRNYLAEMVKTGIQRIRQTGMDRLSGFAQVSSREAVVLTVYEPFSCTVTCNTLGNRVARQEIEWRSLSCAGYITLGYNGRLDYVQIELQKRTEESGIISAGRRSLDNDDLNLDVAETKR